MITRNEAERIANAIIAIRPDWNQAQVMGVLADPRIRERRTFHDALVAMTSLAADASTRQPTRIFEHGPWWELLAPKTTERNTSASIRRQAHDDCGICSRSKAVCARDDSHEYEQIGRIGNRASIEQKQEIKKAMGAGA